ncbi:uncharacterized protein LOC106460304 isoform X2 [Limulus polyphemus]|uniref:Uncharacterized protein LOC106460304 isoform X2 n=1 Tax=Limulus polyphemus TaxID=6850 RepID=A0ABM1SGF5_LIMPO|nr:uncharacterized protein LOC106460304 isoform X2 [Limulus polyphemus]
MNFHDIFQRLFGFRREPEDFRQYDDKINAESQKDFLDDFFRKTPNIWMSDDNSNEERVDIERHSGSKTELFNFDETLREPLEMFKHFQKIFHNFGMLEHLSPPETGVPGGDENPRDRMLKKPEKKNRAQIPQIQEWWDVDPEVVKQESMCDKDLDDEVAHGGLGQFFNDQPYNRSFYKGVSVRTIREADGRTEEQKTIHDSKGNEETTICRTLGDQTYCVTTCIDSSGTKKRKEAMKNLDEIKMLVKCHCS